MIVLFGFLVSLIKKIKTISYKREGYMKKITIISAVVLSVCMTGCEKNTSDASNKTTSENAPVETEEAYIDQQDYSIDIITRYNLPKLSRMAEEDQEKYVNNLQVMKKIDALNLKEEDFIYPEQSLQTLNSSLEEKKNTLAKKFSDCVTFKGSTSDELQKFINNNTNKTILIENEEIKFTSSIEVPSNVCIEGQNVNITSLTDIDKAFVIKNAENISISGMNIDGGFEYGIYVVDSKNIEVKENVINNLGQKPVVIVGDCEYILVNDNSFSGNQNGGIYFDGNINYGEISGNTVQNNLGTSNWMAGIVLCGVESQNKDDIWEKFDENHHFPQKDTLYSEINCPHNIIVSDNYVENNNASGIYGDGAYLCYLTGNMVRNNDKEGICLDYGSFGCYLYDNTFEGNGRRMNQTDKDLEMDFVLASGRLDDGSAKSKLPAISLDNTAYNILVNNVVSDNYGGGVKMVRTTVRCLIAENVIKNNNLGQNDSFHFFGVELGSAIADTESTEMDFTADYENIICRNSITGNHYSGVFIGENGYVNDVFDNVIMQPQMFSVEAISTMFNSIVNNTSDKDVRNEYVSE